MKLYRFNAACYTEIIKIIRSKIFWITLGGFSIAPLVGAMFVVIVRNPSIAADSPLLQAKVNLAGFTANWAGYLGFLNMALGSGGMVIFGFIVSWVFGREYSDKTIKDILVLPVSRGVLVVARFIGVSLWIFFLSFWIFFLGTGLALWLDLSGWNTGLYISSLIKFVHLAILVTVVSFPVGLFASWGKGFMAPLGFVIFSMVIGQISAVLGVGTYSPWSVSGLYSGAAGEAKSHLEPVSFAIVYLTGLAGVLVTYIYWKNADN